MLYMSRMELSIELLLILFFTGLFAGFVDSIAGGGGLLTMPVLLWSGLPPAVALGTNKLQGTIGTLTSSINFYHKGYIPFKSALSSVIMAFCGSALGTLSVTRIDSTTLSALLPLLLMLFAVYFFFSPRLSDLDVRQRINRHVFAVTAGFAIGFYDGFFGPGTGSFYVIAYVTLLGYGAIKATAHTKLLNFSSNISALLFFQLAGLVSWKIGLVMGIGQMIGSYAGSHMTMKHGVQLIKPMLIIVSAVLSIKLFIEAI